MRSPSRGAGGDDPVDMAADAPARDREAELAAVGAVALLGVEIDPAAAQPADGEILELMPDGEDAQHAAGKSWPSSLGAPANSNCSARSQGWPSREPPR